MAIKMIAVVDPSGIPIAVYPDGVVNENDLSVFMGVLRSLDNIAQGLEGQPLKCVEIGDSTLRIDRVGEYIVITKLVDENWKEIDWYFKLLVNSLRHSLNYVRKAEGQVENFEATFFKNILKKYFDNYSEIIEIYSSFKNNYLKLKREKGESVYEQIQNIFGHELLMKEVNDNLVFEDVRTGDLERFKELIKTALTRMGYV